MKRSLMHVDASLAAYKTYCISSDHQLKTTDESTFITFAHAQSPLPTLNK